MIVDHLARTFRALPREHVARAVDDAAALLGSRGGSDVLVMIEALARDRLWRESERRRRAS
jgi:hypothetical protein